MSGRVSRVLSPEYHQMGFTAPRFELDRTRTLPAHARLRSGRRLDHPL